MMRLNQGLMALCLLSVPLAGCGSTSVALREVRTIKAAKAEALPATYLIQTDSNVRNSYLFVRKSGTGPAQTVTCNEPMPDTALQTAQKLAASVEETSGNKSQVGWETSSTIAQLAGRTQTVLIARELLFNSCLMYANGGIDNGQLLDIYNETVELIGNLAETDKQNASEAASNAQARQALVAEMTDPIYSLTGSAVTNRLAMAILSTPAATVATELSAGANCGADAYCARVLSDVTAAAKAGDRDDLTRKLSNFDNATLTRLRVKFNSL